MKCYVEIMYISLWLVTFIVCYGKSLCFVTPLLCICSCRIWLDYCLKKRTMKKKILKVLTFGVQHSTHSWHAVRVTDPCRQPRTGDVFGLTWGSDKIARGDVSPRGVINIRECGGPRRHTESRVTVPWSRGRDMQKVQHSEYVMNHHLSME